MRTVFFLTLIVCLSPLASQAQFFTPGNIVFADPVGDRVVELQPNDANESADLIQIVEWDLLDTKRRRPLGLDIDPNGTVWVGITGEPTSVTEEVEFPTGRVELISIGSDGTLTNYLDVAPTNKATFLSSFRANEVYIMSNAQSEAPSNSFRVRAVGGVVEEVVPFTISETLNCYAETLELEDGRVLISNSNGDEPGIQIYDYATGEQTGTFVAEGNFRSLTYIPEIDQIMALRTDQQSVVRFNMDGTIDGETNLNDFYYPNLWGIARWPGTNYILVGSHNGPAETRNFIGVFDATDLDAGAVHEYLIEGFANVGLEDGHEFNSLFNMAVVIEPSSVGPWELY